MTNVPLAFSRLIIGPFFFPLSLLWVTDPSGKSKKAVELLPERGKEVHPH